MADTLAALTAAGIVYDRADFADPHLPGPTALTVTADGRVQGHLAQWGTCHIGFGDQCVSPPSSREGYRYFHQGVVATTEGDLPVGKLTLGTGHAPVNRGITADAAAAHYDNTGMVAAVVRAGEDEHGIWLSGRLIPGTPQERIDELRRSGVSGDWRGINGNMELVAALAVNVPGFPIPRTEQLVASGGLGALVAAGVVAPEGADLPTTGAELQAMIASAVESTVKDRIAAYHLRSKLQAQVARAKRAQLAELVAGGGRRVKTQEGTKRFGVGIGDLIPTGKEVAEAAGNDARRAGDAVAKAASDAGDAVGDALKPKPAPKKTAPDKPKDAPAADKKDDAPAPVKPPKDDAPAPSKSGAKPDNEQVKAPEPKTELEKKGAALQHNPDGSPIIPDDAPAPRKDVGAGTDHPMEEDEAPDTGALGGKLLDYKDGVAHYDDGSRTDGTKWEIGDGPAGDRTPIDTDVPPRIDAGAGMDHPMLEDESPYTGARGGKLVDFDGEVAHYDDGTATDGVSWWEEAPADKPVVASAYARMIAKLGA